MSYGPANKAVDANPRYQGQVRADGSASHTVQGGQHSRRGESLVRVEGSADTGETLQS